MATVDEIKQTILRVAGDPASGNIAGLAAEMAEEIYRLDQPDAVRGNQKRVVESMETRTVNIQPVER
jgi:hypothetical protein